MITRNMPAVPRPCSLGSCSGWTWPDELTETEKAASEDGHACGLALSPAVNARVGAQWSRGSGLRLAVLAAGRSALFLPAGTNDADGMTERQHTPIGAVLPGAGLAIGAGAGAALGVAIAGATGIPFGIAIGAAVGLLFRGRCRHFRPPCSRPAQPLADGRAQIPGLGRRQPGTGVIRSSRSGGTFGSAVRRFPKVRLVHPQVRFGGQNGITPTTARCRSMGLHRPAASLTAARLVDGEACASIAYPCRTVAALRRRDNGADIPRNC